jgi:hypothetical protein
MLRGSSEGLVKRCIAFSEPQPVDIERLEYAKRVGELVIEQRSVGRLTRHLRPARAVG